MSQQNGEPLEDGAVRPRMPPGATGPGRTVTLPTGADVRSRYLVDRLFRTPEDNLFNHVKFHLIDDQLTRHVGASPRVLDIGCGLQVARRFLERINPDIHYHGVDYEASFLPDAVVDLNEPGSLAETMRWRPDVVMLLDVLEHLQEDIRDLEVIVRELRAALDDDALLLVTVPQMYRMDRFKLRHLHYPEHKIRLTQAEWRALLETQFDIVETQGLGYLSVLPYLPMLSTRYTPGNRLGRLFAHLRSTTLERAWLKPVDLFLSRTVGRLAPFKTVSNDILFVARPRRARPDRTEV